jgi:hypothetical protein
MWTGRELLRSASEYCLIQGENVGKTNKTSAREHSEPTEWKSDNFPVK